MSKLKIGVLLACIVFLLGYGFAMSASGEDIGAAQEDCKLLQQPGIERTLPKGYLHPMTSSIPTSPQERAAGMVCKISVELDGPNAFSAIRYRVFNSAASAASALNSYVTLVPGMIVIDHSRYKGEFGVAQCTHYTTGERKFTFISCAARFKDDFVIASGVAGEPLTPNSYKFDTSVAAGWLLDASLKHMQNLADKELDTVFDAVFGKDRKK